MPINVVRRLSLRILVKLHDLTKRPRQWRAQRAFRELEISPGDIAIDCGANVGKVTAALRAREATVYAFEPNPIAFRELEARFAEDPKVVCLPKAVVAQGGPARLYLQRGYASDPLGHSLGSSLASSKNNLDPGRFIDVETVVLSDFIHELGRPVRVLKIDVEGTEIELLGSLLDSGAIHRVDRIFCETHELKVPGLLAARRNLQRRLEAEGIQHVDLDWW